MSFSNQMNTLMISNLYALISQIKQGIFDAITTKSITIQPNSYFSAPTITTNDVGDLILTASDGKISLYANNNTIELNSADNVNVAGYDINLTYAGKLRNTNGSWYIENNGNILCSQLKVLGLGSVFGEINMNNGTDVFLNLISNIDVYGFSQLDLNGTLRCNPYLHIVQEDGESTVHLFANDSSLFITADYNIQINYSGNFGNTARSWHIENTGKMLCSKLSIQQDSGSNISTIESSVDGLMTLTCIDEMVLNSTIITTTGILSVANGLIIGSGFPIIQKIDKGKTLLANSIIATGNAVFTINFTSTFTTTPSVIVSVEKGSTGTNTMYLIASVESVSTTSFNVRLYNTSVVFTSTNATINWNATL